VLHLLEVAKRRVLTPGAAVVPAGASLWAMAVERRVTDVCGFNLEPANKHRCLP
jgi:type III protein arginine methyltransferase